MNVSAWRDMALMQTTWTVNMTMSSTNDRLAEATKDQQDDGYFVGIVTDNEDPLGIGRIKINVPNLFDTDQGPVPWIGPTKKSPFGQGAGYGVYGSPAIGSEVLVELQDGDIHYGLHRADFYSAKNANPKFKSPQTWGFKDPSGNELFVDMENKLWEFTTNTGCFVKYDADGNINIHVVKDSTRTVDGKETDTITGDSTKTVGGNFSLTISGDANVSISGAATIAAGGACNITGNPINLN